MTSDDLKQVLDLHKLWLDSKPEGKQADLQGADLLGADLQGTNLYGADLREANLRGASLQGANLRYANLRGANLLGVDLREANLRGANLQHANLRYADLHGADLQEANLRGAVLLGANLQGAIIDFSIVPQEGSFIGYKKTTNGVITIEILADAKRLNSIGSRKCRASKVKVLSGVEGSSVTQISTPIAYKIGEVYEVFDFCDDVRIECAPGIHFFITKQEAENW